MAVLGLLLFWVILALAIGVGAQGRGRWGFGWFMFALLFSPLVAFIALILIPLAERRSQRDHQKKCPDCAGLALADARVCTHCGLQLASPSSPGTDQEPAMSAVQAVRENGTALLGDAGPMVVAVLIATILVLVVSKACSA